jgi:hypothetical protein
VSKFFEQLPVISVVVLSGCVMVPSGPSVMVLPGGHKTFEQFREDAALCQQYAQATVGQTTPGQAATDSATQSAVASAALGAAAGALIGSASGRAGSGAAIGAGSGLLLGSAAGSGAAWTSADTLQKRYDIAYIQCMYAKGNQVPVPSGYGSLPSRYPPPPPPPYGSQPPPTESYPPPPASGGPSMP